MFNQQMASLKYSQFNAGVSTLLKGYREVHVNHSYSQSLYHSWNKVFNQPAVNDEVESPQRNTLLMKPAAKALFDQLKEQIGEEIFVGEWFSVDQERINTFAEITQDMQWIHTDPQRAEQESPFKSTIAHGF
ncbi:acyl dehydratase [Vibrio sp. JCM 19236]|nr:acyl dehydratase [Vibrio sp. JCM 19236]